MFFAADFSMTIMANGKNVTDENNVERVALEKVKIRLHIAGSRVKMSSATPKFQSIGKFTVFSINYIQISFIKSFS